MSVSNGQIANQTTFNNAFVSKQALNQDVDGTINLTNASSGADVNNLQQEINDIKTTNSNQDSDITNLENSRVVKAASSTDNTLPRFDGTDGQIIQSSGVVVDDSDNMTVPGSLTVTGDLTVNGTTTTINTSTLDVEDSNITINDGGNDATAEGAGITVERTGTHGKFLYEDALASKFKIGAAGSEAQVATVSHTQTISNKTIVVANNTITTAASGNLTSTELNAALAELQGDIDALGSPSDYVAKSLVDAKGDLIAGSADNTVVRLPVGSNGQVLSADSAESSGLKWISAASNNLSITTKTTTYTATASDDVILVDTSGGPWTLSMYASSGNSGKITRIKKISSDFNALTIDGNGSETIDDALTRKIVTQNEEVVLLCDGSNLRVLQRYIDTELKSFTPTGSWNTNVSYSGYYYRNYEYLEGFINIDVTGALNATAMDINIPFSLTINTTKVLNGDSQAILGSVDSNDSSSNFYPGFLKYLSSTSVRGYVINAGGTYGTDNSVTNTVPATWGAGDSFNITFKIPITEFVF